MRPAPGETEPRAPLTSCPFCRSTQIMTTSEKADASSYWRCQACGEMWNVDRLKGSPNRYNTARSWK